MRKVFHNLLRDRSGASIIEFALITPTLMVLLMGLMDLAHGQYTAQMLQGAVQKSARNSTIEGAASNAAVLDTRVTKAVQMISPGATVTFSRTAYNSFIGAGRAEAFDDANGNGTCDNGELYEDANRNRIWDPDPGQTGFGGARDAVLYTVNVSYRRLFPAYAFIPGQSANQTMAVTTVLRNQPYAQSAIDPTPPTANCT
jgi:Flp pilus assembly protein TadG